MNEAFLGMRCMMADGSSEAIIAKIYPDGYDLLVGGENVEPHFLYHVGKDTVKPLV